MRTVPTLSTHLSLGIRHVAVVSTSLGIALEFILLRQLRLQRHQLRLQRHHPQGPWLWKTLPTRHWGRVELLINVLQFYNHPNIKGCHLGYLGPTSLHHYLDTTGMEVEESSCHVLTPILSVLSGDLHREAIPFPSFQRRIAQVLHQPAQASHRCCTWSPARTVRAKQPREPQAKQSVIDAHICRCVNNIPAFSLIFWSVHSSFSRKLCQSSLESWNPCNTAPSLAGGSGNWSHTATSPIHRHLPPLVLFDPIRSEGFSIGPAWQHHLDLA